MAASVFTLKTFDTSAVFSMHMPREGEDGAIVVKVRGRRIEFRGPPYSQWTDAPETTDSPFFLLHGALEGWHTSPLHTNAVVDIFLDEKTKNYDEYVRVASMWHLGSLP